MKQWIEVVAGGHKARIRYPSCKTRSKTFPTIREARAWQRRTLTEIDDGTYVPDARGKLLFADWAEQFVAISVDLAPATINRRVSDLKNWVMPEFGPRPLGSITQPPVRVGGGHDQGRVQCRQREVALRNPLDHRPGRG